MSESKPSSLNARSVPIAAGLVWPSTSAVCLRTSSARGIALLGLVGEGKHVVPPCERFLGNGGVELAERSVQPIPLTLKGVRRQIHPTRTTPLEERPPIHLNPHGMHPAQCRYGRLLLTPAFRAQNAMNSPSSTHDSPIAESTPAGPNSTNRFTPRVYSARIPS